ncbi:MAG: hypothetical protein WCW56_00390 [Candidatus Paceibacterota bacterium]|jgi:hypothetical protein
MSKTEKEDPWKETAEERQKKKELWEKTEELRKKTGHLEIALAISVIVIIVAFMLSIAAAIDDFNAKKLERVPPTKRESIVTDSITIFQGSPTEKKYGIEFIKQE